MESSRECGQFKKLKWVLQQKKSNYPNKRWGHTSVIHEGKLLIFGGNHSGSNREGVHRLDCETLQNIPIDFAVQPEVRESHSCILYQDSLFIYGGCIGQEVPFSTLPAIAGSFFTSNSQTQLTSDLLHLKISGSNPTWRKIEQKNPIPPRQSHVTVLIQGKFMLIYGGTSPQETVLDQFWLLDIQSASWIPVEDVNGKIEAKIGVTMTPIGQNIYAFGGQWGEGEDCQYSNDLCKLTFEGEIQVKNLPTLTISKVDTSGVRPNPRTGHASIDYKGKMLIIIGGEGVSSKRASILYNDVWSFDLRSQTWSQLLIENRTVFRPRSNFTANIYKNTIYVFGGFVNLNSFKCTDELITLSLTETRHALRQEMQQRNSFIAAQSGQSNQQVYCSQCKFQFLDQERSKIMSIQQKQANFNRLIASTQNIIHTAKFIASPLEGLGLIVNAFAKINFHKRKILDIDLIKCEQYTENNLLGSLLEKAFLSISVQGLILGKQQLKNLVFSYLCEADDPGFNLKNGLFRLGKEILITGLFEDGMLHTYLLSAQGIHHSVIHLQTSVFELQRTQNFILSHFLKENKIILENYLPSQVKIFVSSLNRLRNGELQLQKSQYNIFAKSYSQASLSFSEFIKDYFLHPQQITLKISGKEVLLLPYEKTLRANGTQREQEPTTPFFSKVHIIINEHPDLKAPESTFIKLYALGRRVGTFTKFPFISGFIELNDLSTLNFPRTRCESYEVRTALEQQIKVLMEESKKRENPITVIDLEKEADN